MNVTSMAASGEFEILLLMGIFTNIVRSFPYRKYNDIANWKWTSLLSLFQGLPEGEKPVGKSYTVSTKAEFDALLSDADFAAAREIQLVEVMMDKFDAPRALRRQAELSGKTNRYVPPEIGSI